MPQHLEYLAYKDKFNGNILGFDSKFRFATDRDLSIRLQFVRENKKKIVNFIVERVSERPKMMKKVGAWGLWRVSDIIVTRSSEVEIQFSLKPQLEKALA